MKAINRWSISPIETLMHFLYRLISDCQVYDPYDEVAAHVLSQVCVDYDVRQNQQNNICAQRRLRSAWASAQSDQSLRWPHGETLGSLLHNGRIVTTDQTGRRLIWVSAGDTGHLLGLSYCGSFIRHFSNMCYYQSISFLLKWLNDNKKIISFLIIVTQNKYKGIMAQDR